MLRERLKEIDLKVTELADYLQISRPTLYSYIELYDKKKFNQINANVLRLFNYIKENELAGKRNVVNYILNNMVELQDFGEDEHGDVLKLIKNYLLTNPNSKKSKFLKQCITDDGLDKIIYYLTDVSEIMKKQNKTEQDKQRLKPYYHLINELKNLY
ncbi:MAG: hypothetical protein K2G44_03470 [Clostridia bacterium]|nr:hypothetical protein [Clostridia bacterium]